MWYSNIKSSQFNISSPTPYATLPGWGEDSFTHLKDPLLLSVKALLETDAASPGWARVVKALEGQSTLTPSFMEQHFQPHQIAQEGFFTGYYEPEVAGALEPTADYQTPVYGLPENPRATREAIYQGILNGQAPILAWVKDPIELFFIEIQGSGTLCLEKGKRLRLGFAGKNGYPYTAIGKVLFDQGHLTPDDLNMDGIKRYLRTLDQQTLLKTLARNESYVFFKIRPEQGPVGTLGLELTPERSLAVDPLHTPLGAPVWVACDHPLETPSIRPLQKLMLAQDTGGAIKGPARGDFFWGTGEAAGQAAGQMKYKGKLYTFLPI